MRTWRSVALAASYTATILYGIVLVIFAIGGLVGAALILYAALRQAVSLFVLVSTIALVIVVVAILIGYYWAIFRCARPISRGNLSEARKPSEFLLVGTVAGTILLLAIGGWPFAIMTAVLGALFFLTFWGIRQELRGAIDAGERKGTES
jgi:hypothetical protein